MKARRVNRAGAASWPAPAKINLFLHVTGGRDNGYHDIQTLFQLLDWGDEVRIEVNDSGRVSRLPVSYGVPEAEDLAVRAARMLQAESGCNAGAEIDIHKRVPPGSGMGGGSSDAATVLLVLNRLWRIDLGQDDLADLGASLGADVPVFIRGRSAMASGLGEKLTPVVLGQRHYVLVFPSFGISTSDVFSAPELRRDSRPISEREALAGQGRNDCEAVVRVRYPDMEEIMQSLRKWGRPVMTGTGSGIFLPMQDQKHAMSAAEEIKSLYNVRAVRGIDRSPVHKLLDGR